jgi:hypothetical protein
MADQLQPTADRWPPVGGRPPPAAATSRRPGPPMAAGLTMADRWPTAATIHRAAQAAAPCQKILTIPSVQSENPPTLREKKIFLWTA